MNIKPLSEAQKKWRIILCTVCAVFLICGFGCLQYIAEHFFQVKGFAIVVFDIFVIIALTALGAICWVYSAMPVSIQDKAQKKRETGYKEWIIERDQAIQFQEAKLTRGYALLAFLIASFWAVACIIAPNDVGFALLFAAISLLSGFQLRGRVSAYWLYVVSLPIVLMFLGTWCHFYDLLPVGIGLFFANILAIVIYQFCIKKYL